MKRIAYILAIAIAIAIVGVQGDIAAADIHYLYKLHDNGAISHYTGTPCTGNSCPGWQLLDNNPKTVAIAAAKRGLYKLHDNGAISRYTGTPCTGNSCPGWQLLDNNPKTGAIAAAGGLLVHSLLAQLRDDGFILRANGVPCSGDSCPGWDLLDNNLKTAAIVAGGAQNKLAPNELYQLHDDGMIWHWTGSLCSGDSCPGWELLDNNLKTEAIVAGGPGPMNQLYQLHDDGMIWRYTGTPCTGDSCPGWQLLDNNPKTAAIAAGDRLYQLRNNGFILRANGVPCSGDSCPGWQLLDNNPKTEAIVAGGAIDQLYQLHDDGMISLYTGTPCAGDLCPGWQLLDNNPQTRSIAASYSPAPPPPPPPPPVVLKVIVVGPGKGTVTSEPLGISCPTDCSEAYVVGTMVTLTEKPALGSTFAGWSHCFAAPSCTLLLSANTTVIATFAKEPPPPPSILEETETINLKIYPPPQGGLVPYASRIPVFGTPKNGKLKSIKNPNSPFSNTILHLQKAVPGPYGCKNTVVSLTPQKSTKPSDISGLFGSATPTLPVLLVACVSQPITGPSLPENQPVEVTYTYTP